MPLSKQSHSLSRYRMWKIILLLLIGAIFGALGTWTIYGYDTANSALSNTVGKIREIINTNCGTNIVCLTEVKTGILQAAETLTIAANAIVIPRASVTPPAPTSVVTPDPNPACTLFQWRYYKTQYYTQTNPITWLTQDTQRVVLWIPNGTGSFQGYLSSGSARWAQPVGYPAAPMAYSDSTCTTVVASSTPPPSSAIPIDTSARNNCPALSAPHAGFHILSPTAGWWDKSGNLLFAKPNQPIVVTINVPAGFSTRWLKLPPAFEALTDSAQLPLNSIQVTTSTSPCGNKPIIPGNLGIDTGNRRLLTTDDDRADTTEALRIVPGQVNYLMIWVDNNSTNRRNIVNGVVVDGNGNWWVGIEYRHWRSNVGWASSTDTKYQFQYGAYFGWEASRIFPTGTTPEIVGSATTASTWWAAGAGWSTTGGIAGSPLWTAFWATDVFCPDTLAVANSTYPKASKWGWRNAGNTYFNGTSFPLPTSCTRWDEYLMREGSYGATCATYRCK